MLKKKPESNKFAFTVKSDALIYENKQNGYILLKEKGEIKNIIYQPLVQYTDDNGQQLDMTTQIKIRREEDNYHVTIEINESIFDNAKIKYPIKFDPSFEMYLNKMVDSTVYSKHNINNYLANYAIVGDHPDFGEGWHYVRLRLTWFMKLSGKRIIKSTYSVRNLSNLKRDSEICLMDMNEQWSSTQMLWDTRTKNYNDYLEVKVGKKPYIQFDITEYVKWAIDDEDGMMESTGLLLKTKERDVFNIIATSDNGLYSPFIQLDIETLPKDFIHQENINPEVW